MAEDPATVRPASWLTDHGINLNWTFNELLAAANVPKPASVLSLTSGMLLLGRRVRRWRTGRR